MNVVWGYLPGALFCASIALASYLVMRAERQGGRALLGWSVPSWNATRYPTLFKIRLASYWLSIGIFGLAGAAFFAEFLGIVE